MIQISESTTNLIAEGTRIEGTVTFDQITRVHGTLVGEVHAAKGSTLILSESAVVEGNIHADSILVDGFVRGDIHAAKLTLSGTGRVIGNIYAPSLSIDFGAYFEGKAHMESAAVSPQSTP